MLDSMGAKYLEAHQRADGDPRAGSMVIGMQGGSRGTLDLGRAAGSARAGHRHLAAARPSAEKAAICRRVVERVWPLLADGTITPTPQTTFPLAEAASAHAHLESGDNLGKVVLVVRG